MAIPFDPELAARAAEQVAAAEDAGSRLPARGDVLALRSMADIGMTTSASRAEPAPDVAATAHAVPAEDGADLEVRWYTRGGERPGSAIVYTHGGGMVSGSLDIFDPLMRQYTQWTGVPILAVEYRLAPEHRHETAARDAFAAVRWLHGRARDFGVDPARIAVMGDSAGGGIAAGAAILARDVGLPLARQILIYPMLDDRTTRPDPLLAEAFWDYDMNHTGWSAKLGEAIGTDAVTAVSAPGRLTDFGGLAPAYLEVGTLDIFRDEVVRYAQGLLAAGVDAELHLHPGAPHTYDLLAPAGPYAERWKGHRIRAMTTV